MMQRKERGTLLALEKEAITLEISPWTLTSKSLRGSRSVAESVPPTHSVVIKKSSIFIYHLLDGVLNGTFC